MKNKSIAYILLALIVITFITTALLYTQLPDEIPLHWNTKGQVDRYGGRSSIFITPTIALFILMLFKLLPKIDPKRDNYKKHSKAYNMTMYATVLIMLGIHWLTLLSSMGFNIRMDRSVIWMVGTLFIVIGNYLTQVRHNYFFGIKTPWTLASESVWKKTHRLGGYLFSGIGVVTLILSFISIEATFFALMVMVFLLVIVTFAYSYLMFRAENFSEK